MSFFVRRSSAAFGVFALPFLALLAVSPSSQTVITNNENSGTFANPSAQIRALQETPVEGKIQGTYSTKHLFDTYSAGIQHCQGLAWLIDGRFAISHDARHDRKALFVCQNGANDTVMLNIGNGGYHPGGIQAAGKVVVVPIKGDSGETEVVFMDCRKNDDPKELSYLRIASQSGTEAAGIAYDSKRACHWVITTNARYSYGFVSVSLYKSNGKSLFDPNCRFSNVGSISDTFASEGGTQILFDPNGTMYVAAPYRVTPDGEKGLSRSAPGGDKQYMLVDTSEGTEMLALSAIDNLDSGSPTARLLVDKKLSDSGLWLDPSAGWRWGGTIAKGADGNLQAVAVSRTLTYGLTDQYAKTKTWSQPPAVLPTTYTVTVYTGDKTGAGTDSNITLTIRGTLGATPATVLNPKISGNAFERNRTDVATLSNLFDVGTITSITVTSDDKYAGSAWFLGYIEVKAASGSSKRFTYNGWIEGGNLRVTLR